MTTFARSQRLLVSAGAGALGGAAPLTVLGGNFLVSRMPAQPPVTYHRHSLARIFRSRHTPAATGLPNMVLRLA
jgi:hypothetical protein